MKRNCTNCAFCERFKYFPKDKFEMMRCWQEPGVCDHAFVQSMNEAEDYVCDEHRTKEEREKELKESEDERMMGVIRLALTDVPEERFTTEGTSLSEVLAWMEKQKEQRDYRKLYEDITQSEWFKKAYVGKGTDDESLISNVQIEEEFPKIIPDEKMKQIGEEISKAVVDYINEQFSKIVEKEQKPVRDIVPGDAIESCMLRYLQSAANRNDDIEIIADTKAYKSELISIIEKEQKPLEFLSKEKVFAIMNKLTSLSFCVPLGSDEEKKIHEITCDVSSLLDYPIEQKPAEWSEEDKETIDLTIAVLKENLPNDYFKTNPANTLNMGAISTDELINKLKSLSPQPKVKWSEEDEKMRDYIIHALTNNTHAKEQGPVLYAKEIDWLKSLKDRGNFPKSNTNSPSEWSEEDEAMRNNILCFLSSFVGTSECDSNPSLSTSYPAYQKEIDWLKSLRPQPHWKPSEEQMEALSETIAFAPDTFKPKCTLVTLQDDLKNL